MRLPIFLSVVLALGTITAALADDAPARHDDCWVETIPARSVWVQREVVCPPVTAERRVPIHEDVEVPVFETRQVPVHQTVQEPIFETRETPVFETRRVPVHGPVEVPVTRTVREPVRLSIWNPFACEDLEISLWDRCKEVVCGTEVREGIVDWREEQVQTGVRAERVQVGTEPRQVIADWRAETVQVGTRTERRFAGWRTETVVVQPARVQVVRECVVLPAETVTVTSAPDAGAVEPLPGTERVVPEAELRDERLERLDDSEADGS